MKLITANNRIKSDVLASLDDNDTNAFYGYRFMMLRNKFHLSYRGTMPNWELYHI